MSGFDPTGPGPGRQPVVGGRYRLTRRIATGGMGEVWTADDEVLHREVAVKLLRSDLAGDPAFLERFRIEARLTAGLVHPGIAQVYDYGEPSRESPTYIVMELVPGEPLSARLAREGRLPADAALDIVGQAARAVDAAHRTGLVHRDLKPANLLLTPAGQVKVTDFGIARAADAAALTRTGEVVGTAHYLSPEQALGQPATPASDVYSLGLVLYEMLAGRRPFVEGGPLAVARAHAVTEPPALPADVPAPASALVDRMLVKDPALRPADAAAVLPLVEQARAAVRAAAGGVDTAPLAGPAPDATAVLPAATSALPVAEASPLEAASVEPAPGGRQRPAAWVWLLGGLVVLLAGGLAWLLLSGRGQSPAPAATSPAPSTPTSERPTSASPTTTATRTPTPTPTPTQTPTQTRSSSPTATSPATGEATSPGVLSLSPTAPPAVGAGRTLPDPQEFPR